MKKIKDMINKEKGGQREVVSCVYEKEKNAVIMLFVAAGTVCVYLYYFRQCGSCICHVVDQCFSRAIQWNELYNFVVSQVPCVYIRLYYSKGLLSLCFLVIA